MPFGVIIADYLKKENIQGKLKMEARTNRVVRHIPSPELSHKEQRRTQQQQQQQQHNRLNNRTSQ